MNHTQTPPMIFTYLTEEGETLTGKEAIRAARAEGHKVPLEAYAETELRTLTISKAHYMRLSNVTRATLNAASIQIEISANGDRTYTPLGAVEDLQAILRADKPGVLIGGAYGEPTYHERTAFFEDEGERATDMLKEGTNDYTYHVPLAYTFPEEPVFCTEAAPDATHTEPSLNSQNLEGRLETIEGLYWSIRTALRNAHLRTGYHKGVDLSEIFEKYRHQGKDTQKLTDELRHFLSSIIAEAHEDGRKPFLDALQEMQKLREELELERRWNQRLREEIGALFKMTQSPEKEDGRERPMSLEECVRKLNGMKRSIVPHDGRGPG